MTDNWQELTLVFVVLGVGESLQEQKQDDSMEHRSQNVKVTFF